MKKALLLCLLIVGLVGCIWLVLQERTTGIGIARSVVARLNDVSANPDKLSSIDIYWSERRLFRHLDASRESDEPAIRLILDEFRKGRILATDEAIDFSIDDAIVIHLKDGSTISLSPVSFTNPPYLCNHYKSRTLGQVAIEVVRIGGSTQPLHASP